MDQDKWEHKYHKYKLKYLERKRQLAQMTGGAAKKAEAEEKPKKAAKKAAKKPAKKAAKKEGDKDRKDDDRPVIEVGCVNVAQDKEDLHFEGRVCKTPKIRARLSEPRLHKLVKMALRYLNKRLRMSDVQEVELVIDGKKKKYKGDALDVDLSGTEVVDEINVKMT